MNINNYLFDTHAFLWFMENDDRLSTKIISLSNSAETTFFVSTISFWEMSIKIQLGKLSTKIPLDEIYKITEDIGIKTLGLSYKHISELQKLPLFHKDPFDRILIAQAISEEMKLLSKDEKFVHYSVSTIW
jgi:PIN domain nuclease of toxin-antitoxin system